MATTPMSSPAGEPRRNDALATVLIYGGSIFGGGSVVYLLIQLAREEPDKAFALLTSWGPGYLLAMIVAMALNKLLNKAVDAQAQSSQLNATAVQDVAVQMRAMAVALQQTADKDDRDKQEMQILLGVINSKAEQALDEQKRTNRALERIENALSINRPDESKPK